MTAQGAQPGKTRSRYWRTAGALFAAVAVLNALGFIPTFCDAYMAKVYNALTDPLSRLSALAPLPVGELLMYAGAAMVALAFLAVVALPFVRRRAHAPRVLKGYLKAVLLALLVLSLLFTLNWSVPFRATPVLETMQEPGAQYTLEQLEELRAGIVEQANAAAQAVGREGDGGISYEHDADAEVATALDNLGARFDRLAGYYPQPKAALCSDILEWMGIGGYTYPYTMEVTYNRHVSPLYYPILTAHESVHHRGYYLESEAEFFSYLACDASDDPVLRYSANESMYYYVDNSYSRALLQAYGGDDAGQASAEATERYNAQPQLSEQVRADIDRTAEEREQAYEASVNKQGEQALSGAAESIAQQGWAVQGQVLQSNSYSGVVELLLADKFPQN